MATEGRGPGGREILIDSNVILDILTEDVQWLDWSASQVERLAEDYTLVINPIVYGEVSIRFDSIEGLDEALPPPFFAETLFPGRPPSWPGSVSSGIGGRVVRVTLPCPTSTLAPMPPCAA